MTIKINTASMFEFAGSTYGAAFLAWTIGYFWMLAADVNVVNAIFMLTGMTLAIIAAGILVLGAMFWIVKHVRITIV